MYTTPSSPDAARCWIPCVDSIYTKCAWEFEFIVPSYLEEREELPSLLDDEFDYPDDRNRTVVVCSGDLVEQVRMVVMPVPYFSFRDRLRTQITQAKLSSSSASSFQRRSRTSPSPPVHFTSCRFHLMLLRRFPVHDRLLSCMPFVCQVRRLTSLQPLRSCVAP